MEQLRSNTEKINNYLRHEAGVKVIEIYECEWVKEKKSNPEIIEFLKDNLFNFKSALSGKITKDIILKKIIDGKLFGLVQCDIEVPAHLKSYFSEMTPIFKNVEVGREHISSHMREYCVDNKLLAQPRRILIGSYFGKGILLSTPLLAWYLGHGLIVTDIQQIVEYEPQTCFKDFADSVTSARREGDRNADSSIRADTFKLLGNSGEFSVLRDCVKPLTLCIYV